ncbi:DNA polymerase III subunit beta [Anaplasma phagocytophilum]|nr:DNA polymerase III subunit beta [Anaplasma phagocytophilum]
MQSAVDRVSVVVFDKVKAIKLSFTEDKFVLSSESSDQGDASEELAVDYEGSEYATTVVEIIRQTVIDAIQNSRA